MRVASRAVLAAVPFVCVVFGETVAVVPRALSGVVIEDVTGRPMAGVVVRAAFPDAEREVQTDRDGTFAFGTATGDPSKVVVGAPGYLTFEAAPRVANERMLVRMGKTGVIAGRVHGASAGQVVAVLDQDPVAHQFRTEITTRGDFRLSGLPVGRYRLWVINPTSTTHGPMTGLWPASGITDFDILGNAAYEDTHLSTPPFGGGRINGDLTRPLGPVPRSLVAIASSLEPSLSLRSTLSTASNSFEFDGVIPGSYQLRARPLAAGAETADRPFAVVSVNVSTGVESSALLALEPPTSPQTAATGPESQSGGIAGTVEGATNTTAILLAQVGSAVVRQVWPDADRMFDISELLAGWYHVSAVDVGRNDEAWYPSRSGPVAFVHVRQQERSTVRVVAARQQ